MTPENLPSLLLMEYRSMSNQTDVADVSSQDTWTAVCTDDASLVIDVRTDFEWSQVGIPQLSNSNRQLHLISWQLAPDMRLNNAFIDEMAEAGVTKNVPVYFLCRSGVRSRAAAIAATAAGYGPCYNVAEGFEGVAGPTGARQGGWQGCGLPETKPASKTIKE